MKDYLEQIDQYAVELENFISAHNLPEAWFAQPDHVAIKCADGMDYEDTMEEFKGEAKQRTEVEMHGRRLGTVKLISSVALGNFGDISWIEVMEPRPEKVGKDLVGLDHAEFHFPNFKPVKITFNMRGIHYKIPDDNPEHQSINVIINKVTDHEVKFNDKTLAYIVAHELKEGKARVL